MPQLTAHGRITLDARATKSRVSFGKASVGMRLEAQQDAVFEVFF